MVAEVLSGRELGRDGCSERCAVVTALLPGVAGVSSLELHDPIAHELYGRRLGPSLRVVRTGPLEIDVEAATAAITGRRVLLSYLELRLLLALARRPGHLVPYEEVARDLWGEAGLAVSDRDWRHAVRMIVSRVRRRIGPFGALISSVLGAGLRLEVVETADSIPTIPHPRALARAGRWAIDWDACRSCGRTDRVHNGRGLCTACYARQARPTR